MFKRTALATVALAGTVSMALAASDGMMENPTVGGAPMMADMTIAENAGNAPNLTTLVAAVKAAGLAETLMGAGPYTVFAPTNDAFGKIDKAALDKLLMPENQAQLQQILTCHVVGAEAFSTDIAGMIADDGGMHVVPTVGGCKLDAYMEGGALKLKDENGRIATVTTADVDQSNGVVHVIDRVMLPAGQAG
ncbi:fasciclin domain-containing protein [Pseudooceanicola sediminis]|uniref:Fasciclin domain-containing protein n=1 Tax=Pseudooceanicola sediminis TaxID=2211117 RepID=A0A399J2C4_9RHOB|nr:fasciclin domain-containing protein [Pseudooceanicola sediminis]KAA2313608.1 fasciclin domain-containing protein [Puniceibacterium sp. HSS470]RII38619.1 fasciclin domain-containing protein [Pseudooceanicola sediminis]